MNKREDNYTYYFFFEDNMQEFNITIDSTRGLTPIEFMNCLIDFVAEFKENPNRLFEEIINEEARGYH